MLALNPNWKTENTAILGTEWSYQDAITAKVYEGFLEAGPQTMLQLYIQMTTSWPVIQPLLGPKLKAFYFESNKPGKFFYFRPKQLDK